MMSRPVTPCYSWIARGWAARGATHGGGPAMDNATHLGLDVHKDTIAVAVLRPGQHEPDERTIPNTPEALRALVGHRRSPGHLVACYEAGPTGYDTYRLLTSLGVP